MARTHRFAGVIFDLDGTLTRPDAIDFAAMRRRIGMPVPGSILRWIDDNAASADEATSMREVVHDEEARGIERMQLGEGIGALVGALAALEGKIRVGICTRNSGDALAAFDRLLRREGHPPSAALFEVQLARGSFSDALGRSVRNKPSPEPAHEVLRRWGLAERFPLHDGHENEAPKHESLLFVGDSHDDLLCGRRAGFRAGWITHRREAAPPLAHLAFETLGCVADVLSE